MRIYNIYTTSMTHFKVDPSNPEISWLHACNPSSCGSCKKKGFDYRCFLGFVVKSLVPIPRNYCQQYKNGITAGPRKEDWRADSRIKRSHTTSRRDAATAHGAACKD